MGISGLLQFIKDAAEPVNVKKYRGQTVAVDTYCWLHKGAFSCAEKLAKGEPTDQYVWYCMKFVDMLLNFGVKPILVFDGQNLPSKREVEKSRRERRELNLQKGKRLLREGKLSEARDCFNRCVNITPAMAHNLIKIARSRGVDCVVAPYEADAQLAFLSKSGLAQAVITEDSDLLAFGCKNVILKMDKQGNGLEIAQSHLGRVKSLGNVFTEEKFRHMCILSGCDYLPSLHGIGLGKACKLLRLARDPDILKVIKKMGQYLKMDLVVPDSYLEGFVRANNTFLYQLVFDPRSRRVVPLNPYPENIQPQELSYAGLHIGDEKGLQMALGNLDLNSLVKIDNYNPDAPHAQPTKPRSRSWKDSPSSLPSSSSSIWSRGYSTALPTSTSDPSPSSPPSPSAESRGSTRGQQRVVSVAPLKLPCIKRPREDTPLSDQDMLLQYSSNDQKRPRSEPPSSLPPLSFSSSSFSSTKPQTPLRTRNRFATLLQRRNQDSEEEGLATCSRFFSSHAPASNPKSSSPPAQSLFPSEAQDPEAPEAPSVDTPSPSPPASSPNTPQNTTTDTTTTDTDTTAVSPPAHSPSSNKGLQLFHWSGSHTEQTSCGLSALKRFRFKKENGTRSHSPVKHRAGEDPEELSDSPPSQDNGYFSQSQSSIPSSSSLSTSSSSSLSSDTQGLLCSRLIDLDKDSDADLSPTDRKPNTPTYKAAGLSRPNPTQTLKPRALGPARVSGLKRKSSSSKPTSSKPGSSKANLNNENSPGVQATISGLWKNFGFTKDSPKISHKEPLSPVKDNVVS